MKTGFVFVGRTGGAVRGANTENVNAKRGGTTIENTS